MTPEHFEQHLEVLCGLGPVLPIAELAGRLRDERLPDRCFAVTFDDGYADNLHTAKPILERHGVPASVFLTNGYLDGRSFWWDELAQLLLSDDSGAASLVLNVGGATRTWELEHRTREQTYHELWALLQPLDELQREQTLASIRSQLPASRDTIDRALTEAEIAELVTGDLVDVGAHTITHPPLSRITEEAARQEIVGSKAWLESRLGRPVTAFAYPYGDYGAREVHIVRGSGFQIAFTGAEQAVTPECDPWQVPRLIVGAWDGDGLERKLGELLGRTRGATKRSLRPHAINLGDLRRLTPISREWGFDRGTPIDRHYVERFLEPRASVIGGRVLEMAEAIYAHKFGGDRVSQLDVLAVTEGPDATYTCRLENGDEIPSNSFDCVVCTQVLQYIYDAAGAMGTLHRILKPGGCLLLTVPGITPVHTGEQYGDAWHWSFTAASVSRLCGDLFDTHDLEVEVFGNVLAATAFLYGLAASELTSSELDHVDADYTVIVGAQAVKGRPTARGQAA